jgi:hypothetical protein
MKEPCYICNGKGTWTNYNTESGEELLRPIESDCPDCSGTGYELVSRLREEIAILQEEKEQMKNDALFHRKKADEYLRQIQSNGDDRGLQDWLR